MSEQEIDACVLHATRDKMQGRGWDCPCPLCQLARGLPELVGQIQKKVNEAKPADKKKGVPSPA